jgi:hypothetical protein
MIVKDFTWFASDSAEENGILNNVDIFNSLQTKKAETFSATVGPDLSTSPTATSAAAIM